MPKNNQISQQIQHPRIAQYRGNQYTMKTNTHVLRQVPNKTLSDSGPYVINSPKPLTQQVRSSFTVQVKRTVFPPKRQHIQPLQQQNKPVTPTELPHHEEIEEVTFKNIYLKCLI